MADKAEAQQAILDAIERLASAVQAATPSPTDMSGVNSRAVNGLAEGWAWLQSPGQSHGGGSASS